MLFLMLLLLVLAVAIVVDRASDSTRAHTEITLWDTSN